MELKFNVVKPNLYTFDDEIYFGIYDFDVIPVSRSVDEIVKRNIGDLKVKKSYYEVARSEKQLRALHPENYTVSLGEYLDILQYQSKRFVQIPETVDNIRQLFNLSYIIDAETIEDFNDIHNWRNLKIILTNPEKELDAIESHSTSYMIDKSKTLEKMKKLYEELDAKIPDNYAEFGVISGQIGSTQPKLGIVKFLQLKAENKDKIEDTKVQLIERLKEIDGPCLSFDAPNIYRQVVNLFNDAPELIQRYGDVLNSKWKQRLFRLDP